jgi:hypothetical protein
MIIDYVLNQIIIIYKGKIFFKLIAIIWNIKRKFIFFNKNNEN